jgi:RND family efflux transporter MFP subunit
MNSILLRAIIALVILALGVGGFVYMKMNPITPDRAPTEELVVPVTVSELQHSTEQVRVTAQGTVTPARQVQVRPEVSGRIVEMSSKLMPGGTFPKGAVLARIDARDYEARLAAQRDQVAQATLRLEQERARQSVARQEWELLEDSIPADQANRDLALRIPQIESAFASLAAARSGLAKAELDLERCTLTAPFNAQVLRENVDPGQVVNPQTEVAMLAGTDQYWVQVSVPVEYLSWIEIPASGGDGSPVTIIQKTGAGDITRQGQVIRLLGDLDPAGRLARLLVSIDDPLNRRSNNGQLPLLIGSYVTVEILGRTMENVMVIPRSAIRDLDGASALNGGNREGIWLMNGEDRLDIVPVEVAWRTLDTVYIRNGLEDGARLVISNIPTPAQGMKLSTRQADDGSDS